MSELKSRILTGLMFGIVMISINWAPSIVITLFFGLLVILSSLELSRMMNRLSDAALDTGFSVFSTLLFYSFLTIGRLLEVDIMLYFSLVVVFFVLILVELWRNIGNALLNISIFVFLIIYCVVPFYFMFEILIISKEKELLFPLFLGLLVIIWLNDTMAYFIGKKFGKHKIFERISPKKTWEGTIGGIVFSLFGSLVIGNLNQQIPMFFWLISVLIIVPMSILGDFFESLIKRSVQVKDSGNLLPGHGGILDRFDSVIYAAPAFYFWIILFFRYF